MSDFEAKKSAAIALMEARGLERSTHSPALLRGMWKLGLRIPPPHFATFWVNALYMALFFGVAWGATMWVVSWSGAGKTVGEAMVASVLAGVAFGLFMGAYYASARKRHRLPAWESLG